MTIYLKNKTVVIYHADCLDGFGAAFAAWVLFKKDAEFLPARYGEAPPDVTGKTVFIVDFSYKRAVLEEMYAKAQNLTVIDHHKTAFEDVGDLPYTRFNMDKSGCVLAWEFFHPGKTAPYFLRLIQDRDLWRFHKPDTKPACAALYVLPRTFEEWSYVMDYNADEWDTLITTGQALLAEEERTVKRLLEMQHECEICGVKGLAVNTSMCVSEVGHDLAALSGTFGATYHYDGRTNDWKFSLRSNKNVSDSVDVSKLALDLGGGGHHNAAGFVASYLTFNYDNVLKIESFC